MNLEKGRAHETLFSPLLPPPRENAIPHSFTRFLGEKGVGLNELKRARILEFRDCAEYRFIHALRLVQKNYLPLLLSLSLSISYFNLNSYHNLFFFYLFDRLILVLRYTIEYIQTNIAQSYLIFKNISD